MKETPMLLFAIANGMTGEFALTGLPLHRDRMQG
jgi:hypothetical protein